MEKARRSLEGVRLQIFQRDKLERVKMRGFEDDLRSHARIERLDPASDAEAPAVARRQSRKIVMRHGRGEVIALRAAEGEKFGGRHDADGVQSLVVGTGAAIAVAVKAGHGRGAAALQRLAKNIAGHKIFCGLVAFRTQPGVTERICRELQEVWREQPVEGKGGRRTAPSSLDFEEDLAGARN